MSDAIEKLKSIDDDIAKRGLTGGAAHALATALPHIITALKNGVDVADWLESQAGNRYGRDLIPIREWDGALERLETQLDTVELRRQERAQERARGQA